MAHHSIMRIIELESELMHMIDIQVMRVSVPCPIMVKFSIFNQDITCDIISGQDAVLVVMKVAMIDCQVNPFLPNSGPVIIRTGGLCKFYITHHCIITPNLPDGFSAINNSV